MACSFSFSANLLASAASNSRSKSRSKRLSCLQWIRDGRKEGRKKRAVLSPLMVHARQALERHANGVRSVLIDDVFYNLLG